MEEHELYLMALEKFGTKRQLYKLAEECSELIQAIIKYNDHDHEVKPDWDLTENLLLELADVEIMMHQINNDFSWLSFKEKKLRRLEKLLEKSCK